MDWLSRIKDLLPWPNVNVNIDKKTIALRTRIELGEFEECHVGIVRRERPFWRMDKVDFVHKETGGNVTYTPLE